MLLLSCFIVMYDGFGELLFVFNFMCNLMCMFSECKFWIVDSVLNSV